MSTVTPSSTPATTTAGSSTPASLAHANQQLEIRPGEGGDDAVAFAGELAEALRVYATRLGASVTATTGRTIVLSVTGADPGRLARFTGTHRIQRIPANDPRGRRHTSTATVALVAGGGIDPVELDERELRTDFYRGHGKGGQHRNKTSSAVRLTHLPTGITVAIERGRSQSQNIQVARAEMRRRLNERSDRSQATAVNERRSRQISSGERATKQWTWNQQRDEVLHHETGARYRMTAFLRGDLDG